jgi:pimeloyl-ACP methyl ester carboxylesterase
VAELHYQNNNLYSFIYKTLKKMKKYFILIVGMIALMNAPIFGQRRGGGISTTPISVTPAEKTPDSPIGAVSAPDREVIWVHGFEGSSNSWNRYSDKFQGEYKMRCWRPDYKAANSMSEGAQLVQQSVANSGIAPSSNNIFIAHSMGGLVTREIDKQRTNSGQPELFGGFVTFSTPHRGAILAQNALNGKGDQFASDGMRALITNPVGSFGVGSTWVGQILLNIPTITEHVGLVRRIFTSMGPAAQLAANGPYIRDLNSFQSPNKKIITVAARESGEKMWRELSSLALKAPSTIALHTYGDDDLPKAMKIAKGVYNGAGAVCAALAVVSAVKFNAIGAYRWTTRSVAFFGGASWIKNAPKVWDDLVGANRTEQRQVTTRQIRQDITQRYMTWVDNTGCELQPRIDCSFGRFMGTLSAADLDNLYENVTNTVTVPIVNEENDGVVLKSSSLGLDGANVVKVETRLRTDLGVNHQECMNHEFVTEIFNNNVFNGASHGAYFLIAKR